MMFNPKQIVVAAAPLALEVASLQSGLRQHDVGVRQSLSPYFCADLLDGLRGAPYRGNERYGYQ